MSSFCYQNLILGNLQSSSLHQQVTGLLKVLQNKWKNYCISVRSHTMSDRFHNFTVVHIVLLTCTVVPGQRMNSLDSIFLRKLKLLKISSKIIKKKVLKMSTKILYIYVPKQHINAALALSYVSYWLPQLGWPRPTERVGQTRAGPDSCRRRRRGGRLLCSGAPLLEWQRCEAPSIPLVLHLREQILNSEDVKTVFLIIS